MTSARKFLPALLAGIAVVAAILVFLQRQTSPATAAADAQASQTSTASAGATAQDAAPPAADAAATDARTFADPTTAQASDAPLPTERVLLRNGALDAGIAERSLRSDAFLDDVRRLAKEATQSPAAATMTADYREALQTQLRGLGVAAYPDALACGVSLCMGRLGGEADAAALERWWNDLVDNGTVPHSVALRHVIADGRGGSEVRFVLVADPGAGSLIIPPAPPERPTR